MGIDLLKGGRVANKNRKRITSPNSYLQLLIKVDNISYSYILSFKEGQSVCLTKLYLRGLNNLI